MSKKAQKKKILFIVNPFSGVSKKKNVPSLIKQHLDHSIYESVISFTEYAGHAIELTKEAVKNKIDIVVAVGGDGSVNEVASVLINTEVALGILPAGSGNGFAMHLGLGRNIPKAIQYLNSAKPIRIDSCTINGRPFINVAGTGFDAQVAYKVKNSTLRGLYAYSKLAMQEMFTYKEKTYHITLDDETKMTKTCLLAEVANSQMFGYNFIIAPRASFMDGILDVLLIKKASKLSYLLHSWRFLNGTLDQAPFVESHTAKSVQIQTEGSIPIHYDGEGDITDEPLSFKIVPQSLTVLVPQHRDYV